MRTILVSVMVWCGVAALVAQPAALPRFDVVSVKRNTSTSDGSTLRPEPNGLVGVNIAPIRLVRVAYQVADFQIAGAPDWFTSERYDVIARTSDPVSLAQLLPMVRTLLAERFGLRVVQRQRESRVLELQIDRDGRSGLTPAVRHCALAQSQDAPLTPSVSRTAPPCFSSIPGSLTGRGITSEMLTQELTRRMEQYVVDRTGLAGTFDLDLRWAPDRADGAAAAASAQTDQPPLVTAVREQLGLRLVPARAAVTMYVIESASRPPPD